MPTTKIVTTSVVDDEIVKEDHELECQNFTVIVHQQNIKVDVPTFVEVGPQETIRCMDEMTQKQWEWISTGELFRHLWSEAFDPADRMEPPRLVEVLNMGDLGLRHMAGLIVLGVEACFEGRNVFYRNPETYLHPKTERYIATMLRKMLDLCGKSGTVTEVADTPVEDSENYIPVLDKDGDISQGHFKKPTAEDVPPNPAQVVEDAAEDAGEHDVEQTLKWLSCMEPDKELVQMGDKRVTVAFLTEEVENDTDVGRWFVSEYVRLRDGT